MIFAVLLAFLSSHHSFGSALPFDVHFPCTKQEAWSLPEDLTDTWKQSIQLYFSGNLNPMEGFASALSLRRGSFDEATRLFSEYWISRALEDAGLSVIARRGFSIVAAKKVSSNLFPIKFAALSCIATKSIDRTSAVIPKTVKESLLAALPEVLQRPEWQPKYQDALFLIFREEVSREGPESEISRIVDALDKSGSPYVGLARALLKIGRGKSEETVEDLRAFLAIPVKPRQIAKLENYARLLLGRALFQVGNYKDSVIELRKIPRSANEVARGLETAAWASARAMEFGETIGTAISFQAGGLKKTFSPEASMLLTIALNELCQFPAAQKAIAMYKKFYADPFSYLQSIENVKNHDYYRDILGILKTKGTQIPMKVATEWLRSPRFIANQSEINRLKDEVQHIEVLREAGIDIHNHYVEGIRKLAQDLRPLIQAGDQSEETIKKLDRLRIKIVYFRRLHLTAPTLLSIFNQFHDTAQSLRDAYVTEINAEVHRMNQGMLRKLENSTNNVRLVEIEILDGASKDIIWQNAHPAYREVASEMHKESNPKSRDRVWDWGNGLALLEEDAEVWEDELGAFKSSLFNNCSSKEKYLAVRLVNTGKEGQSDGN